VAVSRVRRCASAYRASSPAMGSDFAQISQSPNGAAAGEGLAGSAPGAVDNALSAVSCAGPYELSPAARLVPIVGSAVAGIASRLAGAAALVVCGGGLQRGACCSSSAVTLRVCSQRLTAAQFCASSSVASNVVFVCCLLCLLQYQSAKTCRHITRYRHSVALSKRLHPYKLY
jgi:hypothetical protein